MLGPAYDMERIAKDRIEARRRAGDAHRLAQVLETGQSANPLRPLARIGRRVWTAWQLAANPGKPAGQEVRLGQSPTMIE